MATPIKATPILRGRDAERFIKKMLGPVKPISREEHKRARALFEAVEANSKWVSVRGRVPIITLSERGVYMSDKVKIANIEIEIGKRKLMLTVEEAKEFKAVLDELFGKRIVEEHHHHDNRPYWWWYTTNPQYKTVSEGKMLDTLPNTTSGPSVYSSMSGDTLKASLS